MSTRFICAGCGQPLTKCVDSRQVGEVRLRNYHCRACGYSQGTIELKRDYAHDPYSSPLAKFHRQMLARVDTRALLDEVGRRCAGDGGPAA
jgi:transcriptional regulator NrdR family protein